MPATKIKLLTDSAVDCTHHWMIDPPDGPYSKGVCKYCKEKRIFPNACPIGSYWDQRSQAYYNGRYGHLDASIKKELSLLRVEGY